MGSDAAIDWRLAARERLRTLVLEDAALAASLAEAWHPEDFAARLAEVAQRRGVSIGAHEIGELLPGARPTPLASLPSPDALADWRPTRVAGEGDTALIEWVWFGGRRLLEPFYEDSIAAARSSPFNRLFGFSTPLAALARPADALEPAGLIFHMSRCGSTLATQMLAALPQTVVVSEAAPLDAVVRLDPAAAGLDAAAHVQLLRAMLGAVGRPTGGRETQLFVKLDSWHTRALPLLRRAFPTTPWIFLIREPVEVLVSHLRRPGLQAAGMLPEEVVGAAWTDGSSLETYAAAALAGICEAAAQGLDGGGLVVNYAELPEAVETHVLPHFGVTPSTADAAAMALATRNHAKAPSTPFTPDSAAKQAFATDVVRAAVHGRLADAYARLEAVRTART